MSKISKCTRLNQETVFNSQKKISAQKHNQSHTQINNTFETIRRKMKAEAITQVLHSRNTFTSFTQSQLKTYNHKSVV